MAQINFPNSPTVGQKYTAPSGATYSFDGVKWVFDPLGISANTAIGATPPESANPGDLWYDSVNGTLFVYYSDGTSSQWVSAVPVGDASGLPDQTGADGKYLRTDGTRVYWGWATLPGIVTPTVTVTGTTMAGVTGYCGDEIITITGSAFTVNEGSDVHAATDWRIVRDSDGATVWESSDDVVNLTTVDIPAGTLSSDSTVYVRYRGSSFGYSEYGTESFAVISAMFLAQIDSPGATDSASWQYDSATDTGYYGFVETTDLIDGAALATQIGLTAGTAQYSDSGWFKFYVGTNAACNRTDPVSPYVIYVASMPYRNNLSWDAINAVTAVYGTRTETIGGNDYRVRLITGGISDPTPNTYDTTCADDPGLGSEWNELFYRIHTAVPDCSNIAIGMEGGYTTSRHGGPQSAGANWAEYTNTQTGVLYTIPQNGTAAWCQETDGITTSRRVRRVYYGLAGWYTSASSNSYTYFGWRPVLEWIG